MSDNKVLLQVELDPDDRLVLRNAVNGEVLLVRATDLVRTEAVLNSLIAISNRVNDELKRLLVERDDWVIEQYT